MRNLRRFDWGIAAAYLAAMAVVAYWFWPLFAAFPLLYLGAGVLVGVLTICCAPYPFEYGGVVLATVTLVSGLAIAGPSLVLAVATGGGLPWLLSFGTGCVAACYGWIQSHPDRTGVA
jgi:hypothetical protein